MSKNTIRTYKVPTKHYRNNKVKNEIVTQEFLDDRYWRAVNAGYDEKAKWIQFCEALLEKGFSLSLYEARETFSKYITIRLLNTKHREYKVRFSNHKPIKQRELQGDCDFFVGVTNTGYRTTNNALHAIYQHFEIEIESEENEC